MKSIFLYLAVILVVFSFSCNQSPQINSPVKKPEVPKPLQDDKDVSFISKRGDNDLMQAIYSDLVKKHADLQKLEDQMGHFNDGKGDSLETFRNYDTKSVEYYRSAFMALDQIRDSLIRQRLRGILTNSQKSYNNKISKFTSLIQKMGIDQLTMADYYLTLKIATTLPVIQDFQDRNTPDNKAIEAIVNESEKLKLKTQKLADKYSEKSHWK